MRRREFITLIVAGATAWPLATRAQQAGQLRRIGLLMGFPEGDPYGQACVFAFRQELQRLGWIEGRNMQIDYRWPAGDAERARLYAKEMIALKSDVIVPSTNQVAAILKQETQTVPIVFAYLADPVGSGLVASIQKPGGNVTGFPVFVDTLGGKWLEILKEAAPDIARIGFMYHPGVAPHEGLLRAAQAAAPALETHLFPIPVRNAAEIEAGITKLVSKQATGLLTPTHAVSVANRDRLLPWPFNIEYRLCLETVLLLNVAVSFRTEVTDRNYSVALRCT
jgi:putative ABC transport system substrate-binding protein